MAPPPHLNLPDALIRFQQNTENLSRQYETVLRQDLDERDQGICNALFLMAAESLLNDKDRLLSLSASHRKYLREKLRRLIVQVRSILQEAVAYDSSQLLNQLSEQCSLVKFTCKYWVNIGKILGNLLSNCWVNIE